MRAGEKFTIGKAFGLLLGPNAGSLGTGLMAGAFSLAVYAAAMRLDGFWLACLGANCFLILPVFIIIYLVLAGLLHLVGLADFWEIGLPFLFLEAADGRAPSVIFSAA